MSRIGRLPIVLTQGVTINITPENEVTVKGPLGELKRKFSKDIAIEVKENEILLTRSSEDKKTKALHGLTRSLLSNMVQGVVKEFEIGLVAYGVGYRATKQANKIILNVGYSHTVEVVEPQGVKIEILPPTGNSNVVEMVVKGIDKEAVGQCAANIRSVRKPEPYHGYGIRYKQETIIRKEGKAAGK